MEAVPKKARPTTSKALLRPKGMATPMAKAAPLPGVTFVSHGESSDEPSTARFDVRWMPDPNFRVLRQHTGRNFQIQRGLIEQHPEELRELVRSVREVIEGARSHGGEGVRIGLMCRRGRHRSVAVAELLGALWAADGIPTTVRHIELDRHRHLQCSVVGCSQCLQPVIPSILDRFRDAVA